MTVFLAAGWWPMLDIWLIVLKFNASIVECKTIMHRAGSVTMINLA